jgi:nucleoside-diphosphate-sugar epimerase
MKKILVTGSSGNIGRVAVEALRAAGYVVTCTDVKSIGQESFIRADLDHLGQVIELMAGQDAVLHLAAIPSPAGQIPDVVFRNNVMSTFHVLEAALLMGVNKVVIASSLSALGFAYRFNHFNPLYIPIDEDHPLLPQDAYGLSKQVGEVIAEAFVRRNPAFSITSMRFTLVASQTFFSDHLPAWRNEPDNTNSFWGYVDVRDAARACRLALEYQQPGHEAFLIAAPETYMDTPTLDLLRDYFPGIPRIAEGFGGNMGLLDCSRAERILGFKPEYHWNESES